MYSLLFCTLTFLFLSFCFFFLTVYFWERERERERESLSRGRTERGRHRIQSKLQALTCRHRAWHGIELMSHEIMTWAKVRCLTNWTTQVPLHFNISCKAHLVVMNLTFVYLENFLSPLMLNDNLAGQGILGSGIFSFSTLQVRRE